jgi:hypothetical protein
MEENVRGARLPRRCGKSDASEIEVRVIPWPLGSKIKRGLDRGASECIESSSTWISGDRQITETTEKNLVCHLFIT